MSLLLVLLALLPLNDLAGGQYLGYTGGLYENGMNVPPPDHFAAGLEAAAKIRPLDGNGNPSPEGRVVLLSIGMSNTTQEFCAPNNPSACTSWSFVGQALADPEVEHTHLAMINGARGGQTADTWDSATDANYDLVRDEDLKPAGLSEAQVQAAWVKVANRQPAVSLPAANSDARTLERQIGDIARALKTRYPNLRIVYLSSRIYAGYATSTLNPEPYAYESAFAVKWAIQKQIDDRRKGVAAEPWMAWGPYLWADGMNPRSDGLTWARSELQSDGTHPSQSGQRKVGTLLLQFFKSEPTAKSWFLSAKPRRRSARS